MRRGLRTGKDVLPRAHRGSRPPATAASSTRQKSWRRPSTRVTGISSPYSSRTAGVVVDGDLDPLLAEVGAHAGDDLGGDLAQVAAGAAVHDVRRGRPGHSRIPRASRRSSWRSAPLRTRPAKVVGSSSTTSSGSAA